MEQGNAAVRGGTLPVSEDFSDVHYPPLIRMIGLRLGRRKKTTPITASKTRFHSVCLAADLTGNRSSVERPIGLKGIGGDGGLDGGERRHRAPRRAMEE